MSYPKPWKSYADQLDQLIGQGMFVTDRARALDYLERIGFYRLSSYWFAFRERSEPLCLLDEHGRKPKKVREERIRRKSRRACMVAIMSSGAVPPSPGQQRHAKVCLTDRSTKLGKDYPAQKKHAG